MKIIRNPLEQPVWASTTALAEETDVNYEKKVCAMKEKVLIIEVDPLVALDLQMEVEELGYEVVGVAESASEALLAAKMCHPQIAIAEVRLMGSMDGIQTARLLRNVYHVPVIFLTAYCDDATITRAARAMPYGYLIKPFRHRELKATLCVALHKAGEDARMRSAHEELEATVGSMRDGLLMVSHAGAIQLMNTAAEALTGWPRELAKGKKLNVVLDLNDSDRRPITLLCRKKDNIGTDEFGWTLTRPTGSSLLVDLSVSPLTGRAGERAGFVVTLRDAAARLRMEAIEETIEGTHYFDLAPMGMMQVDDNGLIMRVNPALLKESGVPVESLLGRTLTGLSMDPDPRIAKRLMHKLLQGITPAAPLRPQVVN
jgi:PAS domain S-box-containing protein